MTRGPRVLLVVEQLRRRVPGGIGTTIMGLLGGLATLEEERSDESAVDFAYEEGADRGADGASGGASVTLYASRSTRSSEPLADQRWQVLQSRLHGPLMVRAWDRGMADVPKGFDVVHASSFAVPPARGVPLAVTVHDLTWRQVPEAFPRRGRRWHEAVLQRVLKEASILAVSSERVAAELVSAGASAKDVWLIPFGCDHLPPPDHEGSQGLLQRLGVDGEFLLTVSTLEPRKNLARLVQAYEIARPRLPERWPLVVVGPDGWGPGVVPGRGVVLAGHVDGAVLSGLYRRARLLAYVPLVEGFGFPPVEAMREGTAVMASRVPSVGDATLEVDPLETDEIADGLVCLASDDSLRQRLASAGYAHSKTLTWSNTARGYLRLWSSLR